MDDFWPFFYRTTEQAILLVLIYYFTNYTSIHYNKTPRNTDPVSGEQYVRRLLTQNHEGRTLSLLRMPLHTFDELCTWLRLHTRLKDGRISAVEKVVIFITITGHGWSYRDAEDRFQHSLDTISR
jgi:hypothetical protein